MLEKKLFIENYYEKRLYKIRLPSLKSYLPSQISPHQK